MALVSSQGLGVPLVTPLAQVKQATQIGSRLRFAPAHRAPQGQPREDAEPLTDGRVHAAAGPAAEDLRGIEKHPPRAGLRRARLAG